MLAFACEALGTATSAATRLDRAAKPRGVLTLRAWVCVVITLVVLVLVVVVPMSNSAIQGSFRVAMLKLVLR